MNEENTNINEDERTPIPWTTHAESILNDNDIELTWLYNNNNSEITHVTNWFESLPNIKDLSLSTIYNAEPNIEPFTIDNKRPLKLTGYRRTNYTYKSTVHAIFTFGKSNYMLGVMGCDGIVYLFKKNIEYLHRKLKADFRKENPEGIFVDTVIINILKFVSDSCKNIKSSYSSIAKNNPLKRNDIVVSLLSKIISTINRKSRYNAKETAKMSPQWILDTIDERLESMLDCNDMNSIHRHILLDKTNLYKRALLKLHDDTKNASNLAFEHGMTIGTKVFSGLIKAGYYPDNYGKLVKECWIHPELAVHAGDYHKINEKDRYYNITKITFDPSSISNKRDLNLTAEGRHPNVGGGGRICIGSENQDTYMKFLEKRNAEFGDLVNILLEVEKSLEVINYDSSFFKPHNGMSNRFSHIDVNPEKIKYRKSTKGARRI